MLSPPRHIAAKLPGDVPFSLMVGDTLLLQSARLIRIQMLKFELLWPEVGAYDTVKFVAAGLGDDLHHAARRLAVLRFVATRLCIDFLDKREIDAGSQCAVISREHTNAAKSAVGDVDAIGHVLIFQPTASRNGGV